MILDSKTPGGPIGDKWDRRKFENKLVNPANKRRLSGSVNCRFGSGGAIAATATAGGGSGAGDSSAPIPSSKISVSVKTSMPRVS